MRLPTKTLAAILVTACLCVLPANASPFVLDASPDTLGDSLGIDAGNFPGQNFVDQFSVTTDFVIIGFDVYSGADFGSIGQSVTIKLFSNAPGTATFSLGQPGTLLDTVTASIDLIDTDGTASLSGLTRKHVSLDIPISAGTYWAGMSGIDAELAQALLDSIVIPTVQLNGNTIDSGGYILTGAVRIEAESVPEPSSFVLLVSALGGLLLLTRFTLNMRA